MSKLYDFGVPAVVGGVVSAIITAILWGAIATREPGQMPETTVGGPVEVSQTVPDVGTGDAAADAQAAGPEVTTTAVETPAAQAESAP